MKEFLDLGYNAHRNEERWNSIKPYLPEKKSFTIADYGSNCGCFSLMVARNFPNSIVTSFDSEEMGECLNTHKEYLTKYSLKNNIIKNQKLDVNFFEQTVHRFDYQFMLSLIHWFDLPTFDDLKKFVNTLTQIAGYTFLEIPTNELYQHNGPQIMKWYSDANAISASDLIEKCFDNDCNIVKITDESIKRNIFLLYKDWREIASGTSSKVYISVDNSTIKKKYRPEIQWDVCESSVKAFDREVKSLNKLQLFSGFPKIKDIGNMELYLNNCGEKINIDNIPNNFEEQCENILKNIKKQKIIYIDAKTDHFLVDSDGNVNLVDFGMALLETDEIPNDWFGDRKKTWEHDFRMCYEKIKSIKKNNIKMGKKVISYCLYNQIPKNAIGAIANCLLSPFIYPGWICRFYVDNTINAGLEAALKTFEHVEIVKMPNHRGSEAMIWRFFPASDDDVDVMISRDADSWVSSREAVCVNEWLASDKGFHIIRDHCYHSQKIMGGVWGVKRGVFPQMKELGLEYSKNNTYDQGFLANEVYPHILQTLMVHYGNGQCNNKGERTNGYFDDGGVEIPSYEENDEPIRGLSFKEIHSLNFFKCAHCGKVHETFIGAILEVYPERARKVIVDYLESKNLKVTTIN